MDLPRLQHYRFEDESGAIPRHDSSHHAEDLRDFHLPLARLHNAALGTGGVVVGFAVNGALGGVELTVEPGVAVDGNGQFIVLAGIGEQRLPAVLPVGSQPGVFYVAVQFNELLLASEDAGGRLEQDPLLRLQPVEGFVDDGAAVVLAVAELESSEEDPTVRLVALAAARRDLPEATAARRPAGHTMGEVTLVRSQATALGAPPDPGGQPLDAATARVDDAVAARLSPAPDGLALSVSEGFGRLEMRAAETFTSGSLRVAGDAVVSGTLAAAGLRTSGSLRVDGSASVGSALTATSDRVHLLPNGGRVGVGTTSPRNELHVQGRIASGRDFQSAGAMTFYPPDGFAWFHIDNGPAGGRPIGRLRISHGGNPGDAEIMTFLQNMTVGIGTPSPEVKLHIVGNRIRLTKPGNPAHFVDLRADGGALDLEAKGADLFINNHGQNSTRIRNLVQISSGKLKEQVAVLPGEAAAALLEQLAPVTFRYTDDPETERIGFIAEELPDAVTTADKEGFRPADVVAVLAGVVRRQQAALAELTEKVAALEAVVTAAARWA